MSEMVERVARALDSACFMPAARGEGYQYRRLFAMENARAAIEAMREPDIAMLAQTVVWTADPTDAQQAIAGKAVAEMHETDPRALVAVAEVLRDWQAMIDAALTTQTQGDGA